MAAMNRTLRIPYVWSCSSCHVNIYSSEWPKLRPNESSTLSHILPQCIALRVQLYMPLHLSKVIKLTKLTTRVSPAQLPGQCISKEHPCPILGMIPTSSHLHRSSISPPAVREHSVASSTSMPRLDQAMSR